MTLTKTEVQQVEALECPKCPDGELIYSERHPAHFECQGCDFELLESELEYLQ